MFAYVAAALAFYCGLRACEIRGLRWKHVDWSRKRLSVRRSKTPAGWRDPSLNHACVTALRELHQKAEALGYAEPEHFVFPWHGRNKKIDPTRSMTSSRSAWRSLRDDARVLPTHRRGETATAGVRFAGIPSRSQRDFPRQWGIYDIFRARARPTVARFSGLSAVRRSITRA
jgi:integrase